jgi:hypothetical protein
MKFLSALLNQGSGKIGGSVFSTNRGGNYIRAKVAPVQPRSVAQQSGRASLAALASSWRLLTPAQIAAWNALASNITLSDSLGNSYTPTGEGLYVGNNRSLVLNTESIISNAPISKPAFPDMVPITPAAAATADTFVVTTGLTAAPTAQLFEVSATAMLSAGKTYIGKSQYRYIGSFAASTYASLNIKTAYQTRWGTLTAKSLIGVKIRIVDVASGFASVAAENTCIVAT